MNKLLDEPTTLPPIMSLIEACVDDVKKSPGRFLTVGLPSFIVSLMMEFVLLTSLVLLITQSQEEGSALYLLAALIVVGLMVFTSTFVQLPIEAGVMRHLWQVQNEQAKFDGRMPIKLGYQKVLTSLAVGILVSLLTLSALVFFIVPGILMAMALTFALPACVVGGKTPLKAVLFSLEHTRRHWRWHFRLALALIAVLFAASTVPFLGQLIGPPFATLLLLRGYRAAWQEDGEPEPVK